MFAAGGDRTSRQASLRSAAWGGGEPHDAFGIGYTINFEFRILNLEFGNVAGGEPHDPCRIEQRTKNENLILNLEFSILNFDSKPSATTTSAPFQEADVAL